jgi:hypothetical protein
MNEQETHAETCVESKLLALHTSTICLARALVLSGALDRRIIPLSITAHAQRVCAITPDNIANHFRGVTKMVPPLKITPTDHPKKP